MLYVILFIVLWVLIVPFVGKLVVRYWRWVDKW